MTTTSTQKTTTDAKETKLRLNRSTLRLLTDSELSRVVGATAGCPTGPMPRYR